MTTFDPTAYGPIFAPLLEVGRNRALDAGQPDQAALVALERLTFEAAFADARIADFDMARCCLAGAWLLHDYLEPSHTISQAIETPSGSFWHGILHRREGDFSNAKYWFRRVGTHAVFEPLALRAAELAAQHKEPEARFLAGSKWEPLAFVDACERAVRSGDGADLCRAVQQAEWELLFDHCHRAAT